MEGKTWKVYIFGTEGTAEAFKMTAHHFGYESTKTGTALVMSAEGYQFVLDNTYAVPAAIVATREES